MTEHLPDPLVPAECDLRDLDGFMLNVERLMASEFVAISSHEIIGAALLLWCRAWKQIPAGSLPDDDRVLAAFSKNSEKKFKKIKKNVLHGFLLCNDRRWYHRVLCAEAKKALNKKEAFINKRISEAERLKRWREGRKETPNETRTKDVRNAYETPYVPEGQGQGQGQGQVSKPPIDPPLCGETVSSTVRAKRSPLRAGNGTRLDEEWTLPDDWKAWALGERRDWDERDAISASNRFRDHWLANANRQTGRKADWLATWRNWVRNERGRPGRIASGNGVRSVAERNSAAVADFLGGGEAASDGVLIDGESLRVGNG